MKKLLTLLVFILFTTPAFAQKNLLPKFVRKIIFNNDSSKHSSFFLLPVFSSAPETGLEVGGSALYSFYTDTVHNDTRVSNIFGYGTVTTKGQSRLSLSTTYWAPHNAWRYLASVSYINFPFDFYGIGPDTYKINKDHLGQKRFKLNFEADKKFGKYIYLGLMAGAFDYKFTNENPGGIFDTNPQIQNRAGGGSLLAGPALIFDTRNNNTYTTRGIIITSYFNFFQGVGSNNSYQGGLLNVEVSQFNPLSKRLMLGFDVQSQNLTGSQSPFYLLPSLGSDELMRGYYNGRYRDRNMIAGQAELRYRFSNRFAVAGFVGGGTVYNKSPDLSTLKPNYGGGLRYFFDVEKGLTIRLDYGAGQKVAGEARQSGVYFSMGEAF
ncbi:BamA/TamA family outer membrane protein [Mucilaginibacter boryungensis]|uniref:Polymerase n=1 Tax=Mucilaginibacter boryungensis TaxID=768480 RepID=A0ABR9XJ51_9SPHI|nr:polymerase [Mucilaginibacter boryungensis]MBE9667418.1 polymerase [Mucilaginibacter boryungensis]